MNQKNTADTRAAEDKKNGRIFGFAVFFMVCAVIVVNMVVTGGLDVLSPIFMVLIGIIVLVGMKFGFLYAVFAILLFPLWETIKIIFGL